jgi:glycosyltransferase involved in cell wall biosynthesis
MGHAQWHLAYSLKAGLPIPYDSRVRRRDRLARSVSDACSSSDLIYFTEPIAALATWPLVDDLPAVPSIVDVCDLEYERLYRDIALLGDSRRRSRTALSNRYQKWFLERNARSWRAWLDKIARSSALVLVTKEDDLDALGLSNVAVVPNGADVPDPIPRPAPGDPPSVVFFGTLSYEPNADAVQYLAEEIKPRLVTALGGPVDIRIVGAVPHKLQYLRNLEGVTVTGYVDDIAAEIRAASVVAVPLRSGSGTRLKVLEAFALQTPVVSTSIGCEGIQAHAGVHLFVADDPDEFAQRCSDVIGDPANARQMAQRALQLVTEKYDWRVIERQVARLADELATTGAVE